MKIYPFSSKTFIVLALIVGPSIHESLFVCHGGQGSDITPLRVDYPASPAFVEETVFSSLNGLGTLVRNQLRAHFCSQSLSVGLHVTCLDASLFRFLQLCS